ncbi:MAG: PDZ domain-containing protein [Myxococcales bacterium]
MKKLAPRGRLPARSLVLADTAQVILATAFSQHDPEQEGPVLQPSSPSQRGTPDDRRKKALVVVVAVLLFGSITLWRSLNALEEGRRWVPRMLEPDCDGLVEFVEQARVPGRRLPHNIHRYDCLPELPRIRLGALQVVLSTAHIDALRAGNPHEYDCLREPKEWLGANGWAFDHVEASPAQNEDLGRLTQSVFLLHNEEVPAYLHVQLGSFGCAVAKVLEGSAAANGGLEVGDLILAVDGEPADLHDPCDVGRIVYEREPHTPVRWKVLRNQVPIYLRARAPRAGERFGCEYRRLPILQPRDWAPTPLKIRG